MKRRYSWPAGHWGWLIPVSHKHGIRAGRMAYVGGQVDKDIKGLVLHHYDLKTQTRVVVNHIRTVLGELGIPLDDLVKLVEIDTIAMRGEDDAPLPRAVSAPAGHWRLAGPFSQGLRCGQMIFVSGQ